MIARTAFAILCLVWIASPTLAADIELRGRGIRATTLTSESLAAMPQTEADVAFTTSKGEERGRYRGVRLWSILDDAGIASAAGHHDELKRSVTVTGRDGYAVLFSAGELAPDFGARPAMLALARNGVALGAADGIRLIVPGDKRGARSVRDIVAIEVR